MQRLNIIQCTGSLCHDKCKFLINIPFPFNRQSFVSYDYANSVTTLSGSVQVGCKQRCLDISKQKWQEKLRPGKCISKAIPSACSNHSWKEQCKYSLFWRILWNTVSLSLPPPLLHKLHFRVVYKSNFRQKYHSHSYLLHPCCSWIGYWTSELRLTPLLHIMRRSDVIEMNRLLKGKAAGGSR